MSDGYATICEKCHNQLIIDKLPAFSLNNLMWLGDVPLELHCLTLAEQKLIALVSTEQDKLRDIRTTALFLLVSPFELCHQVVFGHARSISSSDGPERQRDNISAKRIGNSSISSFVAQLSIRLDQGYFCWSNNAEKRTASFNPNSTTRDRSMCFSLVEEEQ